MQRAAGQKFFPNVRKCTPTHLGNRITHEYLCGVTAQLDKLYNGIYLQEQRRQDTLLQLKYEEIPQYAQHDLADKHLSKLPATISLRLNAHSLLVPRAKKIFHPILYLLRYNHATILSNKNTDG